MVSRRCTTWSVSAALVVSTAMGAADAQVADPATPPTPATKGTRGTPTPEDQRAAGRNFAEGEKAFSAHEFARAADAFEAADAVVPSDDAVWNAARARHRAGDLARAADLYARYLQRTRSGAKDRDRATTILAQLAARLARIDVQAAGADLITVDEVVLEGPSLYVNPGSHVVRARHGGRDERRTFTVDAGQTLSVAFVDEQPRDVPPSVEAPVPLPIAQSRSATTETDKPFLAALPERDAASPAKVASGKPWRPWVFFVEGGATVAVGAVTLGSAIDTRVARNAYLRAPTEEGLTAGEAKEVRTNVLLGVTSGLGLLTLATGLLLVDWRGPGVGLETALGLGPGGLSGASVAGYF
jgi:hypothetical protein